MRPAQARRRRRRHRCRGVRAWFHSDRRGGTIARRRARCLRRARVQAGKLPGGSDDAHYGTGARSGRAARHLQRIRLRPELTATAGRGVSDDLRRTGCEQKPHPVDHSRDRRPAGVPHNRSACVRRSNTLSLHCSFMCRSVQAAQARGKTATPSRRLLAVVLLVFRVLALIVAVQATGAMHAALDLAGALSGVVHVEEDCSRRTPGHDCPPGCPSCHCASSVLSALPPHADDGLLAVLPPPGDELKRAFFDDHAPLRTERASVYRPPRSPRFEA